jgi:hypothetical protein
MEKNNDSGLEPSVNLLKQLIGPCPDVEQRIRDLYIVNGIASWAKTQLQLLGEMAEDHKLPDWYVNEVKRIASQIETVASREAARSKSKSS